MLVEVGDKLGPYEILASLGSGGMGDVYRARDTKLDREVAIKVLPAAVAQDPERLARFEREAKVLGSLNHPNIAQIYGVEEKDGTRALVMELVPGQTLQGPVPINDALGILSQIADALGAAHDKGIIHRDLKPANIMLTPDGVVKVLDFGLAAAGPRSGDGQANPDKSPTLTMHTSEAGMLLGTAAYMSPEQASGKPVDRRSDIFSFGVVVWELLTGKKLFDGETISHILAAVLTKEPDLRQVPPRVRRLLESCLQKDPRQRLQAIGDWRLLLTETTVTEAPSTVRASLPWALAAVLAVIAAWAVAVSLRSGPAPGEKTEIRLSIPLPSGQQITSSPAISRDGRTIAYTAQHDSDEPQLYVRGLNSFESRLVPGSSGAAQPFFSPDGTWVAFFAQGQLQKAEVAGGAPIRLADAAIPFGGTWNIDNTIIYTAALGSGLLRIPANGGKPETLTKPDGAAQGYGHVFPQALPEGHSVLFTVLGSSSGGAILTLDSSANTPQAPQLVLPEPIGFSPIFQGPGSHGRLLVVDRAAGVRAASFDASHPAPTSAGTLVLEGVNYKESSELLGWLSVSDTGSAVYAPGNPSKRSLVWAYRDGKIETLSKVDDVFAEASLSPDGSKAVVRHGWELWIRDLERGTRSRLTLPNVESVAPLWTADGKQIIFASDQGGDWNIYSQLADGSQPAGVLLKRPFDQFPLSISADGALLYCELNPKSGADLWILSPDGKTSPFAATAFNEYSGEFSPGPITARHWIAYSSEESGRSQIYIQEYPKGGRIAVSTGRGILPRWSRDGKELYYLAEDAMMVVAVRPDGSIGVAQKLFDQSNLLLANGPFHRYDVSADGRRFLMIMRDPGSIPRQLNVILNWSQAAPGELRN
jgi:serine/threonine protein kinase